jgi:hypothetical protein
MQGMLRKAWVQRSFRLAAGSIAVTLAFGACGGEEPETEDSSTFGPRQDALLFVEDLFRNPEAACDLMTRRFLIENYGNAEEAGRELCRSDVADSTPFPTLDKASVLSATKKKATVRIEDSEGSVARIHVVKRDQTWMLDRIQES